MAAIGALNSIGHPDMAARMQTLIGDPDPLVRESAVKIAGYFGYAACADGLLERCRDAVETVRAAALEHVAFLDDDRVLPVLTTALEHDTPRARAAAAQALAHVESPQATAALRRAVAGSGSLGALFQRRQPRTAGGRDRAAAPRTARAATTGFNTCASPRSTRSGRSAARPRPACWGR